MRNGKYAARRSSGTKVFSLMLAVLLLIGCSVGATLAWLTATTNEVTNTFTVGNIKIDLKEHEYVPASNSLKTESEVSANENYKLIPGLNMPKDPFVTVEANSEKCWLFVIIEEKNNTLDDDELICRDVVEYSVNQDDDGWNAFVGDYEFKDGVSVYFRVQEAAATDQDVYILDANGNCSKTGHKNGCVTVSADVTSSWTKTPTLEFTAAAIQYDGLEYNQSGVDTDGSQYVTAAWTAFQNLPDDFKEKAVESATPDPEPEI